ncbi:predicted protein [Naegleria gruberi]|uniref:PFAM domain(EF-Hand)-containing protein n=1 Tax=Naegleria gruberi TaxID=5762 RepID=D2W3P3_NAEGR|nr:PFAM domain(EF-Hand)-containing protein [Naegleria gruberi]XP_002669018.1 uncharacterized protein NAEGRDRAFT_76017 [Naegleria gruberi]EFC35838.1 PFAM domain(EF-Hand)-containing protein [Naegleria gruberi]EFC36274.1 predicted protein [Naegleria gruberi]|eukprot:XP_002668582.1 PFAM domain(EF-Hand)-containing protein [Naegleria gruberi strain NEG-M]
MASLTHCTSRSVIHSLFKKYDQDNSNSINISEMKNLFVADMGINFSDDNLMAIQMYMDKDSDGKISFDEFFNYWTTIVKNDEDIVTKPESSERLYRLTYAALLFKNTDTSGNRQISREEFVSFYQQLYNNYSANMADIDYALNYIDTDKSGSLSFQELINWLRWL